MEKLEEGLYYHIYNRGINSGPICFEERHYNKFLRTLLHYLYPAVEIFCYCILINHFHLLVRVRFKEEQEKIFFEWKKKGIGWTPYGFSSEKFKILLPSTQFGHLFNSYTRFVNINSGRTGNLFEGRYKRKRIKNNEHLNQIVCYIHRNPIHHGITQSYLTYPYSSYQKYILSKQTILPRNKVFKWFGGKENFIVAHEEMKFTIESDLFLE